MVTRSKSWIKDNVMGIIIAVMFTAFWVQYESNRRLDIQDKKDAANVEKKQEDQLKCLTRILVKDPDTREEDKEEIRPYLKLETRGTEIN